MKFGKLSVKNRSLCMAYCTLNRAHIVLNKFKKNQLAYASARQLLNFLITGVLRI